VSHKLLRWLSPVIGAIVIVAAVVWSNDLLARGYDGGCGVDHSFNPWFVSSQDGSTLCLARPVYFLFGEIALAVGLL
jgi:hypothetical protein